MLPTKMEKHPFHSCIREFDCNVKSVIKENLCFDLNAVQ